MQIYYKLIIISNKQNLEFEFLMGFHDWKIAEVDKFYQLLQK